MKPLLIFYNISDELLHFNDLLEAGHKTVYIRLKGLVDVRRLRVAVEQVQVLAAAAKLLWQLDLGVQDALIGSYVVESSWPLVAAVFRFDNRIARERQ